MPMQTIDVGTTPNDGTGDSLLDAGQKLNGNISYMNQMMSVSKNPMGFDREGAITTKSTGILQYCHSAASGVVYQIGSDKDGAFSELTAQTHFADGTTALADRTLAIYHDSGETSFSYWFEGQYVEVTEIKTIQLPVSSGNYVAFNVSGNLEIQNDPRTSIINRVLIAFIYNNATENLWFADERHGAVMDGHTHLNLHMTQGFRWSRADDSAELYGVADNSTTFVKVTASAFADEDVRSAIPETTAMPFMYKLGTDWQLTAPDNQLALLNGGQLRYNPIVSGSGSLADVTNNDYIIMTIWATNNKRHPYVQTVAQDENANVDYARDNLPGYVTKLALSGLPGPEMRPICSYIIHETDNGVYTGVNGEIWIDCRWGFPVGRFETLTS